ncbi:MAG: hypothetical protein U0353_05155 [Sandaracinus sp.]
MRRTLALIRTRALVVAALVTLGAPLVEAGCSSGTETPVAREDQDADVRALANQILEDPARLPLDEVDEAIRDERPVLAADLIAQGAQPATERQIAALRALEMTSSEGRRLRSRCVRLYRDRLEALESLRVALSRGIGMEDEQLVTAMHADAQAQIAIVSFQDELARLVPDLQDRPPLEERGAPPRLPSRDDALEDPAPADRPEDPNPVAGDPIGTPEPE